LILDFAMGLVQLLVALRFDPMGAEPYHGIAAAAGAILGHLFSPYLKFSGGKGIATSAGAFAGLAPWAFMCALAVFAIVFATRRIVSLGSLAAAVTLPLAVWAMPGFGLGERHASILWVTVFVMLAVIFKHRGNIRRLVAGTEPALERRRG
jgi:glycerol-3-phosphate acyltransferase PlsY